MAPGLVFLFGDGEEARRHRSWCGGVALLFDDYFSFHAIVAEAAEFGADEIVGAGLLRGEINHLVGALGDFAVFGGLIEDQTGGAFVFRAFGMHGQFDAMSFVQDRKSTRLNSSHRR